MPKINGPAFQPEAGNKWPLQMTILSLIIILTNLALIVSLILFSFKYIDTTIFVNQKIESLGLYNELKRAQLYCHLTLAVYADTGHQNWLVLFQDKKAEFESVLKTAFTKTKEKIVINKLININKEFVDLNDSYSKVIDLVKNRNFQQAKVLLQDESLFIKLNLFFKNMDALFELESTDYMLQKVISQIQFFNDQLRLIMRYAALSGNAKWEIHYSRAERELDFLFGQAKLLIQESGRTIKKNTPPRDSADTVDQNIPATSIDSMVISFLQDSNNKLVYLEHEAFKALQEKKATDTFAILSGKEYANNNELYQKGSKSLEKIMEQKKEQMIKDANSEIAGRIIAMALLLVILALIWFFTYFIYRHLYIELLGSKQKLEDLNISLGQKVEVSTKEIIRRSVTDELTGLPNRLQLDKDLKEFNWRSLAIINIDHFSNYKAAFGPHLANMALQSIAIKLKNILKGKGSLYKLSYDEFAFLSNELHVMRNLQEIICGQINRPAIRIEEILLHVSFGIGVVIDEQLDILRKANLALINAKKSGPGSIMYYKPEFDITKEYKTNIEWIKRVQTALETDTIIPFFQGIRDNRTGTIEKFECLVRIKTNGDIFTPNYFLEPARQAGMLPKLTDRMLEKSFLFFKNTPYEFSINISKEDLLETNFINMITQKIDLFGIATERIVFEVLESMSFEQHTIIIEELKTLKELGFKLAIDDFGTAYSNFARLVDMNIDFLKIDGSFIKNIDTNKRSLEIVRSITNFCHNLNIKLVAEFVHAQSVQSVIEELGIDYSQGYFFSIPGEKLA